MPGLRVPENEVVFPVRLSVGVELLDGLQPVCFGLRGAYIHADIGWRTLGHVDAGRPRLNRIILPKPGLPDGDWRDRLWRDDGVVIPEVRHHFLIRKAPVGSV